MKVCRMCRNVIVTPRNHPDGSIIDLCDMCYEVKFLCDGFKLDYLIETLETVILSTPPEKINFVRTLTQEVN